MLFFQPLPRYLPAEDSEIGRIDARLQDDIIQVPDDDSEHGEHSLIAQDGGKLRIGLGRGSRRLSRGCSSHEQWAICLERRNVIV